MFLDGTHNPEALTLQPLAKLKLQHLFQAVLVCNRLVSGTFHTPSGVLFSFPSRYYCAIGLEKCLALEATFPHLP